MLLDLRGEAAQLLPFRDAVCLAIALEAKVPEPPVMEFLVFLGLDEAGGSLGVVDAFHARSPLRIWAIWMKRMSSPSRSAQPFWCIRHDMSAETMYSAPAFLWSATLS